MGVKVERRIIVAPGFRPGGSAEAMLTAHGAAGLSLMRVAHMKYDFAVDGGAVGEIIPASSPILPNKAIIVGGLISVSVAVLAAAGAATVAIGTHAGSSTASLKAATAKASYSAASVQDLVPVNTAASAFRMNADGQMSITVATNPLTAGVFDVFAYYLLGS